MESIIVADMRRAVGRMVVMATATQTPIRMAPVTKQIPVRVDLESPLAAEFLAWRAAQRPVAPPRAAPPIARPVAVQPQQASVMPQRTVVPVLKRVQPETPRQIWVGFFAQDRQRGRVAPRRYQAWRLLRMAVERTLEVVCVHARGADLLRQDLRDGAVIMGLSQAVRLTVVGTAVRIQVVDVVRVIATTARWAQMVAICEQQPGTLVSRLSRAPEDHIRPVAQPGDVRCAVELVRRVSQAPTGWTQDFPTPRAATRHLQSILPILVRTGWYPDQIAVEVSDAGHRVAYRLRSPQAMQRLADETNALRLLASVGMGR